MRARVLPFPCLTALQRLPKGGLALVTAPAGYGKTTLLRAWSERTMEDVITLTVTPEVDDARALLAAADRLARGRSRRPRPRVSTGPESRRGGASLARALGRASTSLVIDDAHLPTDPVALRLLFELIVDDPWERTVILAGRRDVDIDWSVARMARRTLELGPRQLALSASDVVRAFPEHGRDRPTIERWVQSCDGWPAAVSIALRSLATPDQSSLPSGATPDETEGEGVLRAYVEDQVLSELPREMLDLLTDAALTGSLDAASLDAVRGASAAPQRALIAALGVPLAKVTPGTEVITMAPLLRDVLIKAANRERPRHADAVRAAARELLMAMEDHRGLLVLALAHQDAHLAKDVLAARGADLVLAGHGALVEAGLALVPAGDLAEGPALLTLRGVAAAARGALDQASYWFDVADARRPPGTPHWSPGGAGPVALMTMVFALRVEEYFDPIEVAPDVPMPWVGLQSVVSGFDVAVRGDLQKASGILAGAAAFTQGQPLVELNRLGVLGHCWRLLGRSTEEQATLLAAEQLVQRLALPDSSGSLLLNAQLARREVERGRVELGSHLLDRALADLRATGTWFRTPRLLAIATLLDVARALDRADDVSALLLAVRPLAQEVTRARGVPARIIDQLLGAHDPFSSARSRSFGADPRGSGASTPHLAPRAGSLPHLTPAERRVMDLLRTALPVPKIAERLGVAVPTVRAQVRTIYAKLEVSSRSDAVARVRDWAIDLSPTA